MSEARQRWRLVFSRGEDARFLSHLDAAKLWERAFRRGSIPIAQTEGLHPRPRLIFAAPLPLGVLAERELADLYVAERLTVRELRSRLSHDLPAGYGLIDLYDVWLGAPALAVQLVAADYRLTVVGAGAADLGRATGTLLEADRLDREKRREAKSIAYDLRPLLLQLRVREPGTAAAPREGAPAGLVVAGRPSAELWMRVRHSQELGSGRPDEVVAALQEELAEGLADGQREGSAAPFELEVVRPVRERLWLEDELEA